MRLVTLWFDGIDLQEAYLPRSELLERLHEISRRSSFGLLCSPAGSGKTSLLAMFSANSDFECICISCLNENKSLSTLLKPHEIDLERQIATGDRPRVIILDDALRKYPERNSWYILIKVVSRYIPNTRFIISATHSMDAPVEFNSFPHLNRRDFRLSEEEETQFIKSKELGLPKSFQFDSLVTMILSECSGLIAALRLAISHTYMKFSSTENPSESELLKFYLSNRMTEVMARCFGSDHKDVPEHLKSHLISCLNGCRYITGDSVQDEYMTSLKQSGILIVNHQMVEYASPLARRYFLRRLFPNRSLENPSTLKELITKAIGQMSASLLSTTSATDDFPKPEVSRLLMLEGIAKNTKFECSISPEISNLFSPLVIWIII